MNRLLLSLGVIPTMLLAITFASIPNSVDAQSASEHEITAFTRPYRTVEVAAADSGILSEVSVQEGDVVAVGSQVGQVDDTVLQATLNAARRIAESQGKLNSANSELEKQQRRLEKLIDLQRRNHATQQEVDNAQQNVTSAQANVESVKDELEVKRLEQKQIEAQIRRRRIDSPIDGIVNKVLKDPGEFVSANDPVIAEIVQLHPLLVHFSVPQDVAAKYQENASLSFFIGADERPVSGKIEFVSPVADGQSGTCLVKVLVDNAAGNWGGGEICKLRVKSDLPSNQVVSDSNRNAIPASLSTPK